MKNRSTWIPAIALVLGQGLAGELPAQQYDVLSSRSRGWLGFSYEDAQVVLDGREVAAAVIELVIAGSPADRAAIVPGDTILGLNGRPVDPASMASLRRTLEPGDTVRLRVRRNGQERDVVVVADDRPLLVRLRSRHPRVVVIDTDSLQRAVRVYMDSIRARLDSVRIRLDTLAAREFHIRPGERGAFYFHRRGEPLVYSFPSPGDSLWHYRFPDDSLRLYGFRADSPWVHLDSLWGLERYGVPPVMPPWPTLPRYGWGVVEPPLDSADGDDFPLPPGRLLPPGPPLFGLDVGRYAVAGAELTELNQGLARYFDTDEGLLVLRVAPGTPAARAGLEAGDVVVSAAGEPVHSVAALRWAVAQADRPGPLEIGIVRQGEQRQIRLQRQ